MAEDKPIAMLTIMNAADMDEATRQELMEWLDDQRQGFKRDYWNYSKRFRARLFV
jgi:hypothetical protein